MRTLRIAAAAALAGATLTMGGPASALDCVGIADWRSYTMFVGTVADQREVNDRGGDYLMDVDEVWRGVVPPSVWVTYTSLYPDPFPEPGESYVVGLFTDTTVSNCTMLADSAPHVRAARPDVVRSPVDLGWWSRTWWPVGLVLRGIVAAGR
jgi:hypothetical protein